MDHAVIGIYDCIHELERAIAFLKNEGCEAEDITLITKEDANTAAIENIPVIQVTDSEMLWEMILGYVTREEEDQRHLTALKDLILNDGKYVLVSEKEVGQDALPI